MSDQAAALFEAASTTIGLMGGGMLESLAKGASPHGFGDLMEQRERGELSWDTVCPLEPTSGSAIHSRPPLASKKPYTMLARAEYPCWIAGGLLFTVDLLNLANELMLPYDDDSIRLWSIIPWPPSLVMTDSLWTELLKAITSALQPSYAFGGYWVYAAVIAYAAPDAGNSLDGSTRLTDLTYPHLIARSTDLAAGAAEALEKGVSHGSRTWKLPVFDRFDDGRYWLISTAENYEEENVFLGRAVAKHIGKPYAVERLTK